MVGRYSSYRRGPDPVVPPDLIDRIMIGVCAAIWLVLVGVGVAAIVALADLGQGFHKASGGSHTTWVLYAVIIVSALIIAGAIPVLLRARRAAPEQPIVRSPALQGRTLGRQSLRAGRPGPRAAAEPARRGTVRAVPADGNWSGEAVDRMWLRGTVALTAAIGTALIGVGAATYLMATGHDGAAWVVYGLSGLITVAMPAIEWLYVRQLRAAHAEH
ncbi:DUF2561 family protein [Mycobacterium sp. 1423905.2]|uniref:DUF2561 family protein n=1 Tax=Mycobacterium sp. 1423905.2 TaxID=1856859 RepID=UPI0007FFC324|nr:DUF2561 family protein [Mycobacterium sp. 1423905.2]OBJ57994.1 hypothetical protein A9W95_12215 [Mycobacterium sp. 1423905.2]